MFAIEKEKLELPCPGCQKPIQTTYHDFLNRMDVRCTRCSSSLKIQSMSASRLSQAFGNLERVQKEVKKEIDEAVAKAELNIKRK
jgi:endogenous inhibitor of DNA gyrase (YacG/DUF329 family)